MTKLANMTGVSLTHPLRNDVISIIDFGSTVTEIITNTTLTCTATLIAEDADLGSARHFTEADQLIGLTSIPAESTVVFIYKLLGAHAEGNSALVRFVDYVLNGDQFRFEQSGYTAYDYRINLRSSFSTSQNTDYQPYNRNAELRSVPKVSAVTFTNAVPLFYQNGTALTPVAGGAQTGQAFNANPISVQFMPSIASLASVYVSGILVFNKILTPEEMADITTDPWAITNGSIPSVFTINDSLGNPSTELVFGQTYTLVTTNWGGAPTHVDIVADGVTRTLPVTAAAANSYTFEMPALPATLGATTQGLKAGAATVRLYTTE